MNAANNVSANSGGGMTKTIVGLVIFILVVVGLYYLYNFLYGKNPSSADIDILSSSIPTTQKAGSTASKNYAAATEIRGILDGGQYSTSFWLYVADTKGFTSSGGTKLAHLLEISNDRFNTSTAQRGNTLLFVGLNPINGTLVVRQSSIEPTEQINNTLTATGMTSTKYTLDTLISGYNAGETYKNDDRCDIINGIEYQRWILVTVVGNGRTLDVYLDGKLARSCVYKGNFGLNSSKGVATAYFGLDNNDSLKGYFASGKFYNYALTPDQIWALYQAGPTGYFNIGSFFKNLFNVNVSFGSSAGLNNTPT
jgi:hypothetical protein